MSGNDTEEVRQRAEAIGRLTDECVGGTFSPQELVPKLRALGATTQEAQEAVEVVEHRLAQQSADGGPRPAEEEKEFVFTREDTPEDLDEAGIMAHRTTPVPLANQGNRRLCYYCS